MTEEYLPVRQSLGYKNLRKAILKVFKIDIDTYEIEYDAYEDFSIYLHYGDWQEDDVRLNIGRTQKNGYHTRGPGGRLYIWLPNPNILNDKNRYGQWNTGLAVEALTDLVYVKKFQDHVSYASGANYKSLISALKVLRFYMDKHKPIPLPERLVFYRLSILQLKEVKRYFKTDHELLVAMTFGDQRSHARMDKKIAWYQEKLKHYCDIWRAVK